MHSRDLENDNITQQPPVSGSGSQLTDEARERIAIEVEHLDPAEAQQIYDRRCEELEG